MADPAKRVGLFVTCLVDLIRPSVGFAAVKLLEDAGCTVAVPPQSCCGQPAFNSGDRRSARAIAEQVIEAFAPYDYVVAPSGSCAGMLKAHYPELFHGDPSSGLRELGVRVQPRRLLGTVRGLTLTEMRDPDVCCGFGGTFCVKYPDISNAIVAKKAANVAASGAGMLIAGDLGCLMNMAGKLQRDGSAIEVRHVAEVLAGMTAEPAIGAPSRREPGPRP